MSSPFEQNLWLLLRKVRQHKSPGIIAARAGIIKAFPKNNCSFASQNVQLEIFLTEMKKNMGN